MDLGVMITISLLVVSSPNHKLWIFCDHIEYKVTLQFLSSIDPNQLLESRYKARDLEAQNHLKRRLGPCSNKI